MVNSTDFPPIPPDIASTTTPLLLGTLFNWALYGVLSVQTYIYYLNFQDDTVWQKLLVYGCYIIEVVQTAMTAADLYFWFSTGYGNVIHLANVNISPVDTPILCGIIALIVQCFFAYRIYTLRASYVWICVLIVMTSLLQIAGAFGAGIRAFELQQFSRFHDPLDFPQAINIWLISDTVCDVLIAGAMLLLFHQSKEDGIKHGRRILGKLVRLIVETNMLTAGMALLSFICYVAIPNGNVFICTTLVMGKLYSNTLLVTFNNRIAMRSMSKEHTFETGGGRRLDDVNMAGRRIVTDTDMDPLRVAPNMSISGQSIGLRSFTVSETIHSDKAPSLSHKSTLHDGDSPVEYH